MHQREPLEGFDEAMHLIALINFILTEALCHTEVTSKKELGHLIINQITRRRINVY